MSRRAIKIALLVFLVAVIAAVYFSPLRQYFTREFMRHAVEVMRSLWYAPVLLIVAYAVGCVFAVPASIFVLGAGVIFGWKLGSVYALAGSTLGAMAAYFVGRFLGEGLLDRLGRAGRRITEQAERSGFLSILIVRLIPGPPFAMWNYAAGIARVPIRDYFFGTVIGILPSTIIFTYCADAIFNGTMTQGAAMKKLYVVAGLLIAMVVIPLLLKRWLQRRGSAIASS